MKRLYSTILILSITILSVISCEVSPIAQRARATFVEGDVTQDTVWTLIDSPLVISNDVTVYPNTTLTIEPGVEVRFGGPYSIKILGKLLANGTERVIEFTSNSENPAVGDWDTIAFGGTEKSILDGCSVSYACNGLSVEGGDLEVRNSEVTLCSRNGINVTDGTLNVQGSLIGSCNQNGILVTGDRQVTIRGCTISANDNGVKLTGSEASRVTIDQNIISANTHNGILIDADYHTNLAINHNTITSNNRGVHISSPTDTFFTNNSISHNNLGVLYDVGSHTAQYNDIYDNEIGMDSTEDASVNAEYNYWGDESGPYHQMLNPTGRGNPVVGDSSSIDFISFLTKPFGYINSRPTATLLADKRLVQSNEQVMFFATNSLDERRVDWYRVDFGDGNTSEWTATSVFTHAYSSTGVYNASATVMDDCGTLSINTATVTIYVQNLPPLYADVTITEEVLHEGEEVLATVFVTNDTHPIENSYVGLLSIGGGDFAASNGYTNSTGHFQTTFTAPDVTHISSVRIVATASSSGYTHGSDFEYVEVSPALSVRIEPESDPVVSESNTQIGVSVTSNEQAVAGALVSLMSDGGTFLGSTGITDSDGSALFDFIAPQTTTLFAVNLTATATKVGYVDGMGQSSLSISPKTLEVHMTADPTSTFSETDVSVTVVVVYEVPIPDVNVTLLADDFSTWGLTDVSGSVTLRYDVPPVNEPSNITLTAVASKDRYADGQSEMDIAVGPGQLDVEMEVSEAEIESEALTVVVVHVTSNGTAIENATVSLTTAYGNLSSPTSITDSNGRAEFLYSAPETTMPFNATIWATATRNGYYAGSNETTITVNPKTDTGAGWALPWTMILLILIPVVAVVIVVVLIKLRVITFSEEEVE